MLFTKEKCLMKRMVACFVIVTLLICSYCTPFLEITTAYAAGIEQGETEEPTPTTSPEETEEPSETPQTTEEPSETPQPTEEPSETPQPTEEPEPSESSAPPEETDDTADIEDQYSKSIESLLDENGFLSDEGLLSLAPLPYDEEKYIDVEENEDGSKTLKLYNDPIKFENTEGEYELIDNSIVPTDSVSIKEDAEHEYTNKASDVEVLMAENLDQKNAIAINIGDYSIGFKPLFVIDEDSKDITDLSFIDSTDSDIKDEALDPDSEYSTIEYSDVFSEDIDLQITPTSTGIKEDIILNELPVQTEFSYEFSLENVVPLLREDGNLYFADLENGILVAAIASPVMYDSSIECAESYDIAVTLEVTGENTYKYTMTPDREFLEDENRVYPIIIDPAIKSKTSEIEDTFITSRYSGNNYVNDVNLKIGYGSDLYISRGLIKINQFPSVLAGNSITKVIYNAYQNYSGSSTPTIQVSRITTNWDPATVKWSNKPTLGSVYAEEDVQAVDWYEWDVTSLVSGWFKGTITNQGMYLKSSDEDSNKYKRFYSAENSSSQNYFEFTFKDTTAPNQPASFTAPTMTFTSATGSVKIGCSKSSDLPSGSYGSGMFEYRFEISINGGAFGSTKYVEYNGDSNQYATFTGIPDNTKVKFRVCAVDVNKNASPWKVSSEFTTPDKTGPVVGSVSIQDYNPIDYSKVTTPILKWGGVTDEGNNFQKVQYSIDNASGPWSDLGTAVSGSKAITVSGDGTHTIYVRGVDTKGNPSNSNKSVTYKLDTFGPEVSLKIEPSGNLKGLVDIKATVKNAAGSALEEWRLEFGYGNPATSFGGPRGPITGNTTIDQTVCELDTTLLNQDVYLTVKLTARDLAKNQKSTQVVRFISQSSTLIEAGLQIDSPMGYATDGYQPDIDNIDEYTIGSESTNIEYQKAEGGGIAGLTDGKLFANNKQTGAIATINNGTNTLVNTFNAAAYDNGWVYPEGSLVFLYTKAKDATLGDLFSTSTQQSLEILDTFDTAVKIDPASLNNVQRVQGNMNLVNSSLEGSFESTVQSFAGDVSYIDLSVDQTTTGSSAISYMVSVNGGLSWETIEPVSKDGGVTVDKSKRKYYTKAVGNEVKLRATLKPNGGVPTLMSWSMDVRYTTYANALLVDNTFPKKARGMTKLNYTTHDETNGSIKLAKISEFYPGRFTTGSVESTIRITSNDVIEACLEVEENVPAGMGIKYYISTQAGADGTWEEITPGDASILANWKKLSDPGTQIAIKAEFKGDGTNTPELLSWRLSIKEKIGGFPYMVKLVDEPWNLSTLTGANYMTLLRWEASETASETEGVTYNVYRSTTPYFVPSSETLVAKGIKENSWNDYNLNYGQTFYYKVTAVKMISGHPRESLPSNEDWATIVSEDEVTRRLGLQNYWSYTGFNTGSGTGYVNVSNGNVVYTTTDIVVSDPFLAAVMRRTFNSLANTKTAMGYGWDYSFNTCLMREFKIDGVTEKGMILKDGDGSFHRFAKNGDVYESAKGTFMELAYDSGLDEYQIKRKDNIVYHFDAQSMKLKSFSDNNGNELVFRYDDERGNLIEVENTVGDKVTLTYLVEGAAPGDPDYTYVNYHPDMLESVTWTEDTESDPVSITYTYEYTSSDRLSKGYTTIEDNATYAEEFTYDIDDRLVTITDPEGKETDLNYSAGKVERVTSANGDYYGFTYVDLGENKNGTTITNQNGVSIGYEYDDEGLLYKKKDALYKEVEPLSHCINYTYDPNTYLVTGMSYQAEVNGTPQTISYSYGYENGNITSISGPNGTQTTYSGYNSFNKPTSVNVKKSSSVTLTTTYTYDSKGNLKTTTDPEGKKTTNTYGTVNGDVGYLTQVEGDFGNQTRYTYDSKGRVTEVKEYDNGTYVRTVTSYSYAYDEGGYFMCGTATDMMNNSVTTYYDQLGRKVKVVYPDNSDEQWDYDLVGNIETMTNRSGNEVNYLYDDLYRVTHTTYADETFSGIQYLKWNSDGSGGNDADKVVTTDGTGVQTIEYYDKAGRLVKTSVSNGTTEIVTEKYQFDSIGNCTQVKDNADRASEAEYNALGQQVRTIVDPSGANIQTQYAYDWLGNKTSMTDGEGYTTSYTYDGDSRLSTVLQTVGSNTHTTSYSYDNEEGGYIKNRVTDAEGRVTEAWFDPMGRKVKDFNRGNISDGDDATGEFTQTCYTYDANFRMFVVTRNDGTKEKYTYNNMGQTTRVDYYEASESTESTSDDYIKYVYDNSGRVTQESVYHGNSEQTTTYAYDSMDRVWQMTQGSLSDGGVSVSYTYDDAGKIKEVSYTKHGELRKLGYVYDGYGRIHYITLALDDAAASTVREYVYKTNGDLNYTKDFREFEADGEDYIKTAYTLNNAGLTTNITYTDYEDGTGSGGLKESYTMTYDDRGYISTETAQTNYGTEKTVNKTYTYDAIGRLTQATIDSKTKNYTYDKVGNRLTIDDGTDTMAYTYNQFNQLTGITKNSAFQTSYTYDIRGNQIQEVQRYFGITIGDNTTYYNQTTDYSYDLMNNMKQADISTPEADGDGDVTYTEKTSTNAYNASGQRVKRVENGETTNYYYSGSATLFTANSNNWMLTENVLDLGGQIIASARFDDQNPAEREGFYFYHYDMRGSTTAIVASNGSLKTGYEYDEFGSLEQSGDKTFLNDVTFTGSVTDKSTGLQYMNARFYNPSTGRFLSQDTYSGNAYDPWTQHLYAYTGNNPVNFIDPTGHSAGSIQAAIDELKKQRKTRITMRDNYAKNRWNYAEGSEMFNLLTAGWKRNRQIVKDLNRQISALEELSYENVDQYLSDNGFSKGEEFTGYEVVDALETAGGEFADGLAEELWIQHVNKYYPEVGTSSAAYKAMGWAGVAITVFDALDKAGKNTFLKAHGGGAMVFYRKSTGPVLEVTGNSSTRNTVTTETVQLIYKNGNVTYLAGLGSCTVQRTGLVDINKPSHEVYCWDFTDAILNGSYN